jgi:hypothetical protein
MLHIGRRENLKSYAVILFFSTADSVFREVRTSKLTFSFFNGFEVFAAVTMKNAAFWDIKTQFVPHRRNITSPLPGPAS